MKKVTHWLHIILVLLTGGFWLLPYVVILATTEMYNRGYRAAEADSRKQWSRRAAGYQPFMPEHHKDCECMQCIHAKAS